MIFQDGSTEQAPLPCKLACLYLSACLYPAPCGVFAPLYIWAQLCHSEKEDVRGRPDTDACVLYH